MKHVNLVYLVKSYYKQMILERYYISHHIKLDFSDGYVVPYKELHYIYYKCLLNASKKIKISQDILFSFYNEWDPINAYRDHMKNPIGYIIANRFDYLYSHEMISFKEQLILLNELSHLTKVSYQKKMEAMQNIGVRIVPTLIASSLKEEVIKEVKKSTYVGAFWDNDINGWHPILNISGDWVKIPYNFLASQVDVKELPNTLQRRVDKVIKEKLSLIDKIFKDNWCIYTRNNSNNVQWWKHHLSIHDLESILNHEAIWAHKE